MEKHKSLHGENTTDLLENDLEYNNSLCIGSTSLHTVRMWTCPPDN